MKLVIVYKDILSFLYKSTKFLFSNTMFRIIVLIKYLMLHHKNYYNIMCARFLFLNSFDVRTKEIHLKFHLRVDIDFSFSTL